MKTVTVDEHIVQVVIWALGFLFASLLSIIVWLANAVMTAIKNIGEKQDVSIQDVHTLKSGMIGMKDDLMSIYEQLDDLPELSKKTSLIEQMLSRIEKDIELIKRDSSDHSKAIAELEKKVAVLQEHIKMRNSNNG